MKNSKIIIASLFASLFVSNVYAQTCETNSPENKVALVELYTSEGCSSCPPADSWLGAMSKKYSNKQAIFASFHVTYWDYIGWKDRFAQTKFDNRQSRLVSLNNQSTRYTPHVITSGVISQNWSSSKNFNNLIDNINDSKAPVSLKISKKQNKVVVSWKEIQASDTWAIFVFETLANAQSEVKAGENRGETLKQFNIVRQLYGPILPNKNTNSIEVALDKQYENDRGDIIVVAQGQSGNVLQAVSLNKKCN